MKFLSNFSELSKNNSEDLNNPFATDKGINKILAHINRKQSVQLTAADDATPTPFWVADFDGQWYDLFVISNVICGAGESMTIDVTKDGVSVLSSVFTINATTIPAGSIKKQVSFRNLLTTAGKSFTKGNVFRVIRDYTVGGTPTPMTVTTVGLEPSLGSQY